MSDMPDDTLADRIRIILKEEGWSQTRFAQEVGAKSTGAVGNWLNRNKSMDQRFAFRLQSKHRWSAHWLLEKKGPRKLRVRDLEEREVLEAVEALSREDLLALGRFVTRRST